MPDKDIDRREDILKKHVSLYFSSHHDRSRWNGEGERGGAEWHTDKAIAPDIFNAMDEYFTERALELLEYVVKNTTGHSIDEESNVEFKYKGEWITAKQLFVNFL